MLFFNRSKILLICLFTVLTSSHFAYSSAEFSGHFGKKFRGKIGVLGGNIPINTQEKNQPWHLGADLLYRYLMENVSRGLGLRYRFGFQGERETEVNGITAKYKFITHRIVLLASYRFPVDQLFVGFVFGLDIWKSIKFSEDFLGNGVNIKGTSVKKSEIRSNQFVWNQLSGQLGLEFGFIVGSNFLMKLETGYDLFSFDDLELEYDGIDQEAPDENKMNLNGFYITLGIGLLLE